VPVATTSCKPRRKLKKGLAARRFNTNRGRARVQSDLQRFGYAIVHPLPSQRTLKGRARKDARAVAVRCSDEFSEIFQAPAGKSGDGRRSQVRLRVTCNGCDKPATQCNRLDPACVTAQLSTTSRIVQVNGRAPTLKPTAMAGAMDRLRKCTLDAAVSYAFPSPRGTYRVAELNVLKSEDGASRQAIHADTDPRALKRAIRAQRGAASFAAGGMYGAPLQAMTPLGPSMTYVRGQWWLCVDWPSHFTFCICAC
jgi:hypothetical protein